MSSGSGHLGRRIIDVLAVEPGARLPWGELKERFPLQVRDKSFYRSVRSLERAGYVRVRRGAPPGPSRPKTVELSEGGDLGESLRLSREALDMVAALARARGVPVPKPGEKVPDLPPAVHRGRGY